MGKGTDVTFGISGNTDIPTKENDPVTKIGAFLRRQDLSELLFYVFRIFSFTESQLSADADAVGVTYNTAGCAVNISQKQIGSLSSHTGQLQKRLHGIRYFAAVMVDQHPASAYNVFCLLPEKTAGMDVLFNIKGVSCGKGFQGGIVFKQSRCRKIYPRIGTLGR